MGVMQLQDPSKDAETFTPIPMDAVTVAGHEVNDGGNNATANESGTTVNGNGGNINNATDVHLPSTEISGVDIEH